MVTAAYASILAIWMVYLAVQVIKLRRKHKIAWGDGGNDALAMARSAHTNASEYIPVTLILMFLLEYNGGPAWLIHAVGIIFVLGRIVHGKALLNDSLKNRVRGMVATFATIVALSVLNLVYVLF